MRVLVAHVRYRQFGGEDSVVQREAHLLRRAGVAVSTLVLDSADLDRLPTRERLAVIASQGDHAYGREQMRAAISAFGPDVVHAHNLYPLLGPGALLEAADAGCATVQTLHNYRLSCLAGTHLWNGDVCRQCSVAGRTRGVLRGCYRGSVLQSIACERGVKAQVKALRRRVPKAIICLTEFQRLMYSSLGVPEDALLVKPNSVAEGRPCSWEDRDGIVFVGRLSAEKGVSGLVRAWEDGAPLLRVVGDGPELGALQKMAVGKPNVFVEGPLSNAETRDRMRHARAFAFPSIWYEGLPLAVLEALSEGTPCVAFDGGAVETIVSVSCARRAEFPELARRLVAVASADRTAWTEMSGQCSESYRAAYADERNVSGLLHLYESLIARDSVRQTAESVAAPR